MAASREAGGAAALGDNGMDGGGGSGEANGALAPLGTTLGASAPVVACVPVDVPGYVNPSHFTTLVEEGLPGVLPLCDWTAAARDAAWGKMDPNLRANRSTRFFTLLRVRVTFSPVAHCFVGAHTHVGVLRHQGPQKRFKVV